MSKNRKTVLTVLPDPQVEPTVGVKTIAAAYGLSENSAYAQARRFLATDGEEGIPALAFGRRIRFPTAACRQQLGLDEPSHSSAHIQAGAASGPFTTTRLDSLRDTAPGAPLPRAADQDRRQADRGLSCTIHPHRDRGNSLPAP